jgi:hypothetical protein
MAEESDKMRELKASRNWTARLAVFALAAAGGLGYMFNLSSFSKPDFSEKNVVAYTQRNIERQIIDRFSPIAAFDAKIAVEAMATEKSEDMKPGTLMQFAMPGGSFSADLGEARAEALEQIQQTSSETKRDGNTPIAGMAFLGIVMAGSALQQNRRLKTPAP